MRIPLAVGGGQFAVSLKKGLGILKGCAAVILRGREGGKGGGADVLLCVVSGVRCKGEKWGEISIRRKKGGQEYKGEEPFRLLTKKREAGCSSRRMKKRGWGEQPGEPKGNAERRRGRGGERLGRRISGKTLRKRKRTKNRRGGRQNWPSGWAGKRGGKRQIRGAAQKDRGQISFGKFRGAGRLGWKRGGLAVAIIERLKNAGGLSLVHGS